MDHKPPPSNWGTDQLAVFIDDARNNVFASYQRLPAAYKRLADIERAFRLIGENLLNPTHLSDAVFLLKAHSSYLGSAHLALAGQVPEAFMLMRGALENALYALYINKTKGAAAIWANRNDSADAKKACRRQFTTANVMLCLKQLDSDLHGKVDALYERTIELGAHPNLGSLAVMLKVSTSDRGKHYQVRYLTTDKQTIADALRSSAQVGIAALLVFERVFRERFALLGITAQLPTLKDGL